MGERKVGGKQTDRDGERGERGKGKGMGFKVCRL